MNKINFLKRIFGFLVVSMLFMGGFSIVIYLIAMIMGSNNAVKLTTFITSVYYPIMIRVTSIGIGIGLIILYVTKSKILTIKNK